MLLSHVARASACMLLLSASLLAQVFTVSLGDYHAQLEAPGFAKLLDDSGAWRCDVFAEGGDLVVANGALEQHNGSVTDLLEIEVDSTLVLTEVVTIHDGCGFVYRVGELGWSPPDRAAAQWLAWYYDGGPEDPDLDVAREWDWGGPNPDPSDAGATGSGRVAWSRWPLGMAIQHLMRAGEDGSAAQWDEVYRWGAEAPWDRAQNYHHAEAGPCCSDDGNGVPGRRFRASFHPDAAIGWGYRSSGGPSNIYGKTEWFGRVGGDGKPVRSKGKNWVDRQHGDQAGTVWCAAATGSWAALRSAYNLCEVTASQNAAGGMHFPNSRSIGWPVRSFALLFKLTNDPTLLGYIDAMDERMHELRGYFPSKKGPRFYLTQHKPLGGHLDSSDAFEELVEALGYQGSTSDLLEWDSSWMASIAGLSFLFMSDAVAGTGDTPAMAGGLIEGRNRWQSWRSHARWAAAFVFVTSTAPGFDVETMEHREPGWPWLRLSNARSSRTNIWSDTRKSGSGESNWVVGVGAGTVLPFGEDFVRRFPEQDELVLKVTDGIAERCYDIAWWDGKEPDRFLLDRAHTWAGRRGWKPKGWKPPQVPVTQGEDG